jgi:hypothetical protein
VVSWPTQTTVCDTTVAAAGSTIVVVDRAIALVAMTKTIKTGRNEKLTSKVHREALLLGLQYGTWYYHYHLIWSRIS